MSGAISSVSAASMINPAWHPSAEQEARLNHQLDGVEHALNGVVKDSTKSSNIPAHETRVQQQAREAAEAKITRQQQIVREAKEAEVTLREQQAREAREHGLPAPCVAPAAMLLPADPISATQDQTAPAVVGGVQARLLTSRTTSSDPSNTMPAAAGTVGEGTHPLRPVPQNGGELSEALTTVADINAIINDIDPTLLADPSQKGEGRLKGLPYGKMFEAAGKATGIDPAILYADSQVETGDNKNGRILVPNNVNPIQTAPGVWPTTANAATNLFTGAYVMKDYINRADGDLKCGLNAYNSGNLAREETGFADGYTGYYEGVMAALGNVEKAIKNPSIIEPGQGGNVSVESQI